MRAIQGTSNIPVLGTEGIDYQMMIKLVLGKRLRNELVALIVENFVKGILPVQLKELKIVMIPKPRRDLIQTKN